VNTLLYLVYGEAEHFHLELTYSVLTAVARSGDANDFRIVLACEENVRRDDLPVEHLPFSKEEFLGWTFGGRFLHAAKIGALKKAAATYDGKLALIDTDTYFVKSPSEIFDRIDSLHVVLHRAEGPLALYGQVQAYRKIMANYSGHYSFDEANHMFNASVIGMADRAKTLLDEVARLTKDLLDISPTNLHTLEQFAFGVVLGSRFEIKTCDDLVRHYSGWTRRFVHRRIRKIIPEFSEAALNAAFADTRDVDVLPQQRKIDVVRSRIKAWQRPGLNDFAFAYLCYLSAFNTRSCTEANAWADTALDFITYNDYPRALVAADFERFRADRFDVLDWMESSTRDRWAAYWRASPSNDLTAVTTTSPALR